MILEATSSLARMISLLGIYWSFFIGFKEGQNDLNNIFGSVISHWICKARVKCLILSIVKTWLSLCQLSYKLLHQTFGFKSQLVLVVWRTKMAEILVYILSFAF